ncbi:MAG: GLPGLI family protein [Gemmatimonadota bacterium]|nr:MAG: GLPGLI family protein [Gemmatimonadota bacterium]
MKRLLACLLILSPAAAAAQQGVILYERAVKYEFEIDEELAGRLGNLEEMMPTANVTSMLLFFSESASLMMPAPVEEEEVLSGMERRAQGLAARLKMGSTARSDQEVLLQAYANYEDGTVAETYEFMGRTFLIPGTRPTYAWKLPGEQSEFLGYTVQKATAEQDSTTIEAWFAPEIPISTGPGLFGGLPGMILVVSVNDGHTVYSATEVNLTPVEDGVIKPPDDGQEVSRDEYEEIVSEKLAELEAMQRSRRSRRP